MRTILATTLTTLGFAASAAAQSHDSMHHAVHGSSDSAYAAMQARGKMAMGVDQYTSKHKFEDLADGGRITLEREVDDSAGVNTIRGHMREIAQEFQAGDFSKPFMVHDTAVPGTAVMKAKRSAITYSAGDTPRGGFVRLATRDPEALHAIHDFLAYQRREHRTN